jgi:flagellar biosynthesis protein FlhF
MRIRRFTGANAQTVLRQIRATLGEEALILATRARRDGVEITAAVDVDLVTAAVESAPTAGASELETISRELRELGARVRHLDRALHPALPADSALGSEARALAERLQLGGLASHIVAPVAASFEAERRAGVPPSAALGVSLERHLLPAGGEEKRRVTALVGPTGCGKTTTIAKLAAAERRSGGTRVGLVMADNYRIGAAEQLGAYARLLGVPMRVARDANEVRSALEDFADRDRVFVDTAGLAGDPASHGDLRALLGGVREAIESIEVTAVFSAATSEAALRRMWRQIEPLAPASCVITKLDEGAGLGAACGWIAETGVRPRWLGTGQRVPQDLAPATGSALAQWLTEA